MPSKHGTPRDHSHYGPETQEALKIFQDLWVSYSKLTGYQIRENPHRTDAIQSAWDRLAIARKAETGSGFYLEKSDYDKS